MHDLAIMLAVLVCSFIIGYVLISRVPPLLHTPLMSMTNAVSAVTVTVRCCCSPLRRPPEKRSEFRPGAQFSLVGGFAITDQMLRFPDLASITNDKT